MILIAVTTACMMVSFSNRLKEQYLAIGEAQAGKVASLVTVNAVSSLLKESYSQVSFIDRGDELVFNTGDLNALLRDSVNAVYGELKKVEAGTSDLFESDYGTGIIYEVPFHAFSQSVLLSSFGPRIPVKYSVVGDVQGQMASEVESFGINNALIHIVLKITVSSRIAVPLISKLVSSEVQLPVYSKIFTGEVPSWIGTSIQGVDEQYSTEIAL